VFIFHTNRLVSTLTRAQVPGKGCFSILLDLCVNRRRFITLGRVGDHVPLKLQGAARRPAQFVFDRSLVDRENLFSIKPMYC
jgi:hypothetical protein